MAETDLIEHRELSPWWRNAAILVIIGGFAVLGWLAAKSYSVAPPIPARVVSESGQMIFTGADVIAGQEVFLKYALMENGTVWGHGAYLGPDFTAEHIHEIALDASDNLARREYGRNFRDLGVPKRAAVTAEVTQLLKDNRYHRRTGTLVFTPAQASAYRSQIERWRRYFANPATNAGLPTRYFKRPDDVRRLTAFFAWSAWASVARRPGKRYSYTLNFPYDPQVGNTPTIDAVLWSALSLISLLAGTAAVLFAFGKFGFLGWRPRAQEVRPAMIPGVAANSQRATAKFFALAALLFLAQALVGSAIAHSHVNATSFYGIALSNYLPSNILRTWHLQLATFWIATSYIGGALLLATAVGRREPRGQVAGINLLFVALGTVIVGSLLGELAGINQVLGKLWFWFGHQGWEYLDLGRGWQILLVIGLAAWIVLLRRAVARARRDPERREMSSLFLYAALGIPIFYLPAMFFGSATNFTVVETWRFWIIHLWVEGFFELFVTTMVAMMFYLLGLVQRQTAARVVYLDAILYLGAGIIGTGHHWYWTGQWNVNMALAAVFSAMEVVPLTLLTLDAWDFVRVTQGRCDVCGKAVAEPHRWTFYFLIAVGVWNFVGAGIFGFLINLPIVSYFEVGTIFTPNHAHAAMMGVFGTLAVALMVFAMRQVSPDALWPRLEKYVRVSFWGLNIGLGLMVILNLFPGGVVQLWDVLNNGYWHARSAAFWTTPAALTIGWLRLPADAIFIVLGIAPLVVATAWAYVAARKQPPEGLAPVGDWPPRLE